jgi:hypothetical protein
MGMKPLSNPDSKAYDFHYTSTCKYPRAWQIYLACEQTIDGSGHPKNLVKVFEDLPVLWYSVIAEASLCSLYFEQLSNRLLATHQPLPKGGIL